MRAAGGGRKGDGDPQGAQQSARTRGQKDDHAPSAFRDGGCQKCLLAAAVECCLEIEEETEKRQSESLFAAGRLICCPLQLKQLTVSATISSRSI